MEHFLSHGVKHGIPPYPPNKISIKELQDYQSKHGIKDQLIELLLEKYHHFFGDKKSIKKDMQDEPSSGLTIKNIYQ